MRNRYHIFRIRNGRFCVNGNSIANEILMYFRNQKKSAQDVYISDPIDTDKDGNQLTLMDVVSCDDTISDDVDFKIKAEKLHQYIKTALDGRERMIIELRYGIDGHKPKTQREVAKILGISRSYVSRIEKKALLDLKEKFESEDNQKHPLTPARPPLRTQRPPAETREGP